LSAIASLAPRRRVGVTWGMRMTARKKKDAWETLHAGVVRMKIPMPVWFGVVAPCLPTEASQKNSRTN